MGFKLSIELVVAICTFNRPEGLRDLLTELVKQSKKLDLVSLILVVDNSCEGNASWVMSAPEFSHAVQYIHAEQAGLSNARNVALRFARDKGLALAFIDDDEVPDENWLQTAAKASGLSTFEILAGPVVPDFGGEGSQLSIPKEFWERPLGQDGEIVDGYVGDGNIIYPKSLIISGLEYSQEFSLTGGQDTDFLMRAKKLGFKIKNLNDLAVIERVPPVRQTVSYLTDRAFHSSSSWVAVLKANRESQSLVILSIAKRAFLFATFWVIWAFTSSSKSKIKSMIYAASVKGSVHGLRGMKVNRYISYQGEKG